MRVNSGTECSSASWELTGQARRSKSVPGVSFEVERLCNGFVKVVSANRTSDPRGSEANGMISEIIRRLQRESRRRKFDMFMELFDPGPEDLVLDVGVASVLHHKFSNLFEQLYPYPERIIALSYEDPGALRGCYPGVKFVRGDGRALPFADEKFDVAISNAVLEHVGNEEDQRRFVRELCRVADKCFITTPNRRFPVELHARVPFIQYMPAFLRNWILRKVGKDYLIPLWGIRFNLLSARELRALFPEDANVRIFGLRLTIAAESLVAVVTPEPSSSDSVANRQDSRPGSTERERR